MTAHGESGREPLIVRFAQLAAGILILAGIAGGATFVADAIWTAFVVAPRLAQADALIREDKIEESLAALIAVAQDHPDEPVVLYQLAGLYATLENPLMVHFYKTAYSRVDDPDWARKNRLSSITVLLDYDVEAELQRFEAETAELFQVMERDRQFARLTDVQAVMQAPASSAIGESGYFYPRSPLPCAERRRCGFKFGDAQIFDAIKHQRARSTETAGGPECCALALSDPDLRPLTIVQREFFARLAGERPDLDMTSIEGARLLAQFRARVLMKHYYLFGFTKAAGWRSEPSAAKQWVMWATYAAWFAACIGVLILPDAMPRRARDKH